MYNKKFVKIFFYFIFFITLVLLIYTKFFKNIETNENIEEENKSIYSSNIINDVEYATKDKDGNEYLIKAKKGEIDFSNSNIIFLTDVYALITLKDSEKVTVVSDFGKYNSYNFDTIFSKNVIINYLDNKITGEYLDFSLESNSMIISKNVIYYNLKNKLKADVIEMNIKTKDTKIFMREQEKRVNIKSLN